MIVLVEIFKNVSLSPPSFWVFFVLNYFNRLAVFLEFKDIFRISSSIAFQKNSSFYCINNHASAC